ncbi:hypothetical protein [Rhodoferax ferrireducens]|uniref:hypothetical protein n=1 Tax=Rhodoferax ferrireducens TaxID=192843 RepID=UPI003BB4A8E2
MKYRGIDLHSNNIVSMRTRRGLKAILAVFGKPQVTMFELAGIVGQHLVDAAWAGNTLMQPRRRTLIIKILERTA